jgi:hypothetical protein
MVNTLEHQNIVALVWCFVPFALVGLAAALGERFHLGDRLGAYVRSRLSRRKPPSHQAG